ncbi:LysM peptidoglycan-binding domain-containing protein [bacterium]|nr:MAG: LysM peptidoglycan-binding domain-containing protein [bacterium]
MRRGLLLLLLALFLSSCAMTYGERHHVARGETIESIAAARGLSASEIREMNYLGPADRVSEGDTIFLPAPGDSPPLAKAAKKKIPAAPEKIAPAEKKPVKAEKPAGASPPAIVPAPPPAKQKPAEKPETAASKPSSARLLWPLAGAVVRGYGEGGGKGIDIAARGGERVKASAGGQVNYAGLPARAYGTMVILDHGGEFYTVYSNMSALIVKTGEKISAGQVLGSSGDYLHFEVRKGIGAVDPLLYLPAR